MKNEKNKGAGKTVKPAEKRKAPQKNAADLKSASSRGRQNGAATVQKRGVSASSTADRQAAEKRAAEEAAAKEKKRAAASLFGFCVTVLVTLLLLFLLIFDDMAFFGDKVRPFLHGLIGEWGLFLLPAYLIAILVTWFKDRKNDKTAAKRIFAALNYLSLIMVLHFVTAGDGANAPRFGTDMYVQGKTGVGTGFIGGNAFLALDRFIGSAATVTLLVIVFLLTLPVLFNSTPLRALRAAVRFIRTLTVQVSDVTDDEEEITAYVPTETPRGEKARSKPSEKAERSAGRENRPIYDFADDGKRGSGQPVPIPEQAEINRTRPQHTDDAEGYREIFAEDADAESVKSADTAAETDAITVQTAEKADENSSDSVSVRTEPMIPEEAPYAFPPIALLAEQSEGKEGISPEEVKRTSEILEKTLSDFGVGGHIVNTCCGPTITRYELQPDVGIRIRKIANLSDDIALHLAATSVRMECPIPGKSAIGIEIPNKNKNLVRLRELIESEQFRASKNKLFCCLGADVVGNPVFLDVEKMPHLLIAGATGMGKSVCINSLLVSLLYRARPDEVKLILVDPKKVEFTDYNGIPHLLIPVVTDPKKAAGSLNWAVGEMERRFSEIQEVGARNLQEYNEITADDPEKEHIPCVVIVIDELADLMMTAPKEVESSICRLAQKARAAGMHLIIGTQRPSVDVITGLIKANIPSRIACKVASQVDSRTILDVGGAEKLLGRGDMLYNPVGVLKPVRVQGAFVSGSEVISVCTYLKQAANADYNDDVIAAIEKEAQLCGVKPSKRQGGDDAEDAGADPLEMDAIELAIECGTLSTSLIQRRLSVGYGRAARIIDRLYQKGIVGQFDPAEKKRQVLITREGFMQMQMNMSDDSARSTAETQ